MSTKKKNVQQNKVNRLQNKSFLSAVKTAIKKAKVAISIQDANMKQFVSEACSMIDKASTKNIFKKNKASRLKSKLQTKLHGAEAIVNAKKQVEQKIIKKQVNESNKT